MRLVSGLAIASVLLLGAAPAVLAAPGRADTFYTFRCIDPDGNLITAESVDARAIEQGGKLMGSAHWELAHPDYDCWVEARSTSREWTEPRYDRTPVPSTVGESLTERPCSRLVSRRHGFMPIRVDAYTNTGMAGGWLLEAAHLREALERGRPLELNRATWQAMADLAPTTLGTLALDPDDLIVVVGDDESIVPVHAVWHSVGLEAGVYRIEGELPTMPGFDPGRALTRPTGEFVLLRDVRVEIKGRPDVGEVIAPHAFVNRYTVERVEADLMLGFFFPGAVVDTSRLPGPPDGVTAHEPLATEDPSDQEPADPAASATPATPG